MKNLLLIAIIMTASNARAACVPQTSGLRLGIPAAGDGGTALVACIISDFQIINSSVPILTSTISLTLPLVTVTTITQRNASGIYTPSSWTFAGGSISVTTGTYGRNGVVGISTNCAAGKVLTLPVVSGGIITGGTCAAIAGSGDVILASTQTFTGRNTFNSGVTISSAITISAGSTMTVSNNPVNFSTATANGLTSYNIVQAWAMFDGTTPGNSTIYGSYNIPVIAHTGTGAYTVYFGTSFKSQYSYTCTCVAGKTAGVSVCKPADGVDQAAGSIQIGTANSSAGAADYLRISIICVGAQ